LDKLSALRLDRRLAVEVSATNSGRRAFVDITPGTVEPDCRLTARVDPQKHCPVFPGRVLEYDAELLDAYDHDIGAALLRSAAAVKRAGALDSSA
jgi:hypothetical protein